MARTQQSPSDTTPSQFPNTTPPGYPSPTHDFTLQAVMEMQKTLGQLTQAVTTLTETAKENRTEIGTISKQVYAAKVVITIAGVILAGLGSAAVYLLCEVWKAIYPVLQIKPPIH